MPYANACIPATARQIRPRDSTGGIAHSARLLCGISGLNGTDIAMHMRHVPVSGLNALGARSSSKIFRKDLVCCWDAPRNTFDHVVVPTELDYSAQSPGAHGYIVRTRAL